MDQIGRPGDDFRGRITSHDVAAICERHSLPRPVTIEPEVRGNEKVIYYLNDSFALQFFADREDSDDLQILAEISQIPSPNVIAWCEYDPRCKSSYLITEKCPGRRLDEIWEAVGEPERLQLLRGLGQHMAKYHAVEAGSVVAVADRLGLYYRITDNSREPTKPLESRSREITNGVGAIDFLLSALELDSKRVTPWLEDDCVADVPLIASGLASGEPWEEHYILGHNHDGYTLTGRVDFSGILICDPAWEVVVLFASILGLDKERYDAYKEGYQTEAAFPDDGWQRFRRLAAEFDAWALLELSRETEVRDSVTLWRGKPMPDWRRNWVVSHYNRLFSWLDFKPSVDKSMFRAQIGPW